MSRRFASILLFLTILAVSQDASRTLNIGASNVTVSPPEHDRMTSANTSPRGPSTESPEPLGSMDINWNTVVDYVINTLRAMILAGNHDEISIPDIDRKIANSVHFHAEGGRLGRLSTLYRAGDVIVKRIGHTYSLSCAVGLRMARVRYSQYVARVWGHGPRGDITAAVGKNAIRVAVTFNVADDGECSAKLDEVRVIELADLGVRVTGMGFLNGLASTVASAQLAKRKALLVARLEDMLTRMLSNMLEGFRCDEYLSMLMF